MRYIRLIVWKEFSHIKADPLMMRLIVLPVLVQLFVIGYALTTEVKNTPVAVLDWSGTPRSRSLIDHIRRHYLFEYYGQADDKEELVTMIDDGTIKIGLVIPHTFGQSPGLHNDVSVQMLIDGQDANSSSVASGYLREILSGWNGSQMKERAAGRGGSIREIIPVRGGTTVLFNPMLLSSWYMIPGLVVLLVTIVTSLLTGFSIVKEKERGTFEQLLVTPVGTIHILIGKIIPFLLIGLAEIVLFLIIAILWFGIPFRGSFAALFGYAVIYMISSLGIGILTSTLARTSQQVLFSIWFILIFFILMGGFFIPVENMPGWVQMLTVINPVRYFIHIVRDIFLKGAGFVELWREGLSMLAIGMAVFTTSVLAFSRKAK
ncbi:MAG: ABC transporter permease subunit [Chitinivibrionales bacterium]|nr:ABC transporter permease subunit [Chitinivibrionales bacterium]